jgi:predicted ATPase
MITELRLRDFKNFKDATLRLGPFTVVVGANASGKSNIRDAFRFLHGVGRGYSLAEIIGGKYGAGGQLEWAPLRGGANEIIRLGADGFAIDVTLASESSESREQAVSVSRYHIGVEKAGIINGGGFRMSAEALERDAKMIYSSHPNDRKLSPVNVDPALFQVQIAATDSKGKGTIFGVPGDEPALDAVVLLPLLDLENQSWARRMREALGGIRFLDLVPDQMRKPAFPGQNVLGDSGENLSTVLWELCQTSERKAILIDWIQELTPMDIVDFEFPLDPSGLVHLLLKERSGITISAYSASDGSLRFLALLAALLGTHPARLYFFEEIETGIHPSRLRLLLDLIEHQTAKSGIQVIATTHSPDLLQLISDSTFNNTSVVYRPRDTDHATIQPVAELPNAPRLRAEQGLGPLHASGWMEDVLFFNGGNEQAAAK